MSDTIPAMMSLPARYYVDPDYYQAEREWFFCGMWVYGGRTDEIPNRGDFVLREIAGESVVLLRDDCGAVAAFYNVCRHRGTRLCDRPAGNFASTIECPYHAWNYNLNGDLVRAPQMNRVDGFRSADYPLHRVAVDHWDGHVFLNLAEEFDELTDQLGELDKQFRPWRMEELRLGKRVIYDVAANWKLMIHNYSECLHCPGVHPALQKLSHYLSGENEPATDGFLGGRMSLRPGISTLSFDGQPRRACLPGLGEEECRYVYFYAVLPNLLLSLHPDYVITYALWPRGVGRTEIVCEWLFHPDTMAGADFDPEDAVAFWDLTNRQDWHVCEQMQLGLGSRAYRPGPYSHREELLPQFDQIILELERAMSPIRTRGAGK
jgi:Rieske 2Fe-2S family protein